MKAIMVYLLAWTLAVPTYSVAKAQSVIGEHQSTQTKAPKVLLIVADGVRPDALIKAQTPSIDRLRETAVFSHQVSMTYPTISGNGWTTILTGVTSEHHGVINNQPEHFEVYSKTHRKQKFPVLPAVIETNNPDLSTASFVKWPKINYYLNRWSSDAYNISVFGGSIEGKHVFRAASENAITEAAVKFLTTQPSDFVFYGFGETDSAGHQYGFRPNVPQYISAIENFDKTVGQLVHAVKERETFNSEDWLIILTTDHGGGAHRKKKHHETPKRDQKGGLANSTIYIYAAKLSAQPAVQSTYQDGQQTDVAPTVLQHLRIAIPSYMKGKPLPR